MRKLKMFTLALALLLVSVGIKAQTVYINEDFTGWPTSGVGSTWDRSDNDPTSMSTSYQWKGSSAGYSGYCAYSYMYGTTALKARLKSPSFQLPQMKNAIVKFMMKGNADAAKCGLLNIYISTDGGVTYESNVIASNVVPTSDWEEYSYAISGYSGTVNLVLEAIGTGTNNYRYIYIDNLVVMDMPTCQPPTGLYVNGLTGSGATFNWDVDTRYGVTPDQYSVTLRDENDAVVYYNAAVMASPVAFTGLNSNTTYTAWVRSNCDVQSYQGWSDSLSFSFTTLPAPINLPFVEDFDSIDAADFPPSGYYVHNATLNSTKSLAHGGSGKSVKLTTTATDNAYIIFPLMNVAANNVEMDFWMRRQGNATSTVKTIQFKAGYLTDPSDMDGTFVSVLMDSLVTGTAYVNFRCNTGGLTDVTNPVMMCIQVDAAYATSVQVDDIDIHVRPNCIRPENLTCSDITDQTITLSWDLANASSYTVSILNLSDSTVTTQTTTQSPYTVTGLTQNTAYEFTVQGICSATTQSQVSVPAQAKTACAVAVSTLFLEDAETTTGTALPDCWTTDHIYKTTTGDLDPFYTGTTTKRGTRGFAFRNMSPAGDIAYLCSQALNFDSTGKYSFRYEYYRATSTTTASYEGEGLKVFVTPTLGDTTNAIEVIPFINHYCNYAPAGNSGWNTYEGVINYQGVGYIMIVGTSKYGSASWFDNLEVFLTPSCSKVSNIAAGTVGSSTFDFSWDAGNNETQWILDYKLKMGTALVYDSTVITNAPNFTVAGLQQATKYTVSGSIRALCGVGDTADAVTFSFPQFTTRCGALSTLPYTNDFENETTGSTALPAACWSRYNDATGTINYYPYCYSSTTYFHSGSKGLYFFASTSTTYAEHQMAILPEVDTTVYPINTLRLKFWAKYGTNAANMIIGVMTDPADLTTFVAADTVIVNQTTHQQYIAYLNNYVGNGSFIAIRLDRQSAASYCYFDDVTLDVIPSCIDLDGSATISDNTESSVRVTLVDQTATSGWSYAYGVTGTAVTDMTPVDATGASVVLSGLASATTYDLYVRRNCGAGDYSPWAAKVTFSTTAVPATTPYSCSFEDVSENNQWMIVPGNNATNKFAIGTAVTRNGSQSIYVSNDNGTTNAYTISSCATRTYAYRTVHFNAAGYQIEFYWQCTGGEGTTTVYDYGRVMLLPVSEQIVGGTNTSMSSTNAGGFPASAIFLDPDTAVNLHLATAGWHKISKFVNFSAAPGNYNLVLVWNNDGSGGTATNPLVVDDITITELNCIPPVTITPTIAANTATLSVNQPGSTAWEFVFDTVAFAKDAVPAAPLYRGVSTTGTATINGLTPNTEYYYTVRTICGVGDTSLWLDPASLRTYCAAYAVPYTEDFENIGAANCWSMMASETTGASVERTTAYHHATGSASLKAVKAAVISPEYAVDSLTHYMINGWAYSTVDSTSFGIGVIVDPNDAETYETVSSVLIPAKNIWTEFTAYFTILSDPDYEDFKTAKHIVMACGDNTIYFDDVLVGLTPTCPKPTETRITNITAHSFDISFTDNAQASQWVVYTNGTPNVITTNPATISGLAASTNYSVSIAAICSATDTSYTTDCGSIRTACDKLSTPWVCSFESSEGYTGGTSYNAETTANFAVGCWDVLNQKPGGATYPYAYVTTTASYAHTGSQGVYTYSSSSATKDLYMILPEFADPSNMLKVKIWYKNGGTTTSYSDLKFGYFTDPSADTTFVSVYTFPKSASSTTWTEGEVLTNAAGYNIPANARIGFMIDHGSYGYGLYFDDVTVSLIRSCSDPATPVVSDIAATSAKVTFTDTCATHTSWQYVCVPDGYAPGTGTPVTIDTTVFLLNGLNDDAVYDVYVRAICGAGDTSNYVPATFRTLCLPFHVTAANPFLEDFNSYNYNQYMNSGTCFTVLGEPTTNTYWAKAYPTATPSATATTYYFYGHSANRYDKCLYWAMYSTYLTQGTILRQFHLDAGQTYEVAAWVRNSTTTSYQSLISAMMGVSSTNLDTMTTLIVDGATATARTIEGYNTYPYNELYQQIKFYVTPDSTADYFIGYNCKNNTTGTYTYLYFDDWSIRAFDGCSPVIPTVDSVTTSKAYVSVEDTTAYQFEYVLNDTTAATTVVTSNTFVIDSLSASSAYVLYFRKYCDATTPSEWIPVQFNTACGAVTAYPYVQGFEGSFPPACWSQFTYGTTAHVWTTTGTATYVHSGSKAAYISDKTAGAKTVLTTGEFNLSSANGYYLRFWMYRYNDTYNTKVDEALHVGYLNTPITATNITAVNEIGVINRHVLNEPTVTPAAAGYYMYEFEVPAGVTGSVWFSFDFHNQYGGGIYLDDITIEPIPSCVTPKTAPVVSSTTMTTATVSVDMKNKPEAQIAWTLSSRTDSIIGTVNTTTGTAIATGLTGSTTYSFKYRFLCVDNDTSAWSPAVTATTTATDCFEPQNLRTVGVVNDRHAAITWGKAPDAVAYEYILKQGNNVVDSAQNMNDTIVYDSLQANTLYVFKVRTLCATDTSAWQTINIKTTYPCFSLPFICGFEDGAQNAGWQMNLLSASGNNQLTIGGGVSMSGSNAMYVSDDGSTYQYTSSSQATVCDAEILLEIPAGNYYVSYDWKAKGESSYDYGRFFLVPSSVNVTGTTYSAFSTSLPTGAISLDNNNRLNLVDDWTNFTDIINIPNDNVYKLVVVWANDGSGGTQPPLAIDNIRIEEVSCMPVNSVNMISIFSTSAKAKVLPYDATTPVEYGFSIYDTEDSIHTWTLATSDTLAFDSLNPGGQYYIYVRHACDSATKSPIKKASFLTPNNAVNLPFVATFETNDSTLNSWTMTSGTALNWYTVGSATSATGQQSMYVTDDGSSHHYSSATGTTVNSYAYIPIQFPAGSFDVSYQWYCHGESTFDYGHVFLAPSTMIPQDNVLMTGMSGSAVPTGTISLDGTYQKLNSLDSLNDVWFDVATEVQIANAGTYNLIVAWHNDASVNHQPPFAIDNIKIKELTCPKPDINTMSIDSSSVDMVRIKVSGMTPGKGILYHVASDNSYSDTIASGVVYDSLVTVTGLSAATWYFARVAFVCAVGDTSSAINIRFRTDCGVITQFPYDEDFETYSTGTNYKTELTNNCWSAFATSTSAYHYMTTTASYVHTGSKALYIYNASATGAYQTLAMPKVDTLAGKQLSMWYKNYSSSTSGVAVLEVGYLSNPDDLSTFSVLKTAPFNPAAYSEFVVDYPASTPAGARPAFKANGIYYLYVDDIHINKVVQGNVYYDTICFGGGYNDHGFVCPAGSLAAGDTALTSTIRSTVAGVADSMTVVNLYVRPEIVNNYFDSICEGQPYVRGEFNIPNPQTMVYFRQFTSVHGCDSTVNLSLYVYPSNETLFDTICQGDAYQFGGQTLTQTGVYTDSILNPKGCKTYTVLNLFVADTATVTNASICSGGSYVFEGQTYTQAGTYRVQKQGIHGCPMTAILNLTVLQNDSNVITSFCKGGSVQVADTIIQTAGNYVLTRYNAQVGCNVTYHITATEDPVRTGYAADYACQDHLYYGYGLIGVTITQDTSFTQNTKTWDGLCDSVTVVTVRYYKTTYAPTEEVSINAGEYYTWHENTYNTSGVYTFDTININGCDSVCTLKLTVGGVEPPTGVDNVEMLNISLVPNPVNAGQTSFVYGNFTNVKSVEVLNSFGQVIDTFVPETYPIEVQGINASGIYYVRVVTEDDKVAVQKLIVK